MVTKVSFVSSSSLFWCFILSIQQLDFEYMLHATPQSHSVVTTDTIDRSRVREIRRRKLLVTFHSTVTIIGENNSIQKVVMRQQPLLSPMFHALSQEERG